MWSAPFADDGPDEDFHRRMSAPENEIPVALPQNLLLAHTDDVAVALVGLQVYTTGVAFTLIVRARPAGQLAGSSVNDLVWQHRPGAGRFMMGLEFSDGRRVSNLRSPGRPEDVVFTSAGGSGGEASVEQSWWLHPVPPEGPLRVVVRCAELGIEEADVVLDGTAISRAAEDVVSLWPWAPPTRAPARRGAAAAGRALRQLVRRTLLRAVRQGGPPRRPSNRFSTASSRSLKPSNVARTFAP